MKDGNTHPLNSKNRQITFATTSSFFSSGAAPPALPFVRAASRSDDVAPRHSAKSIVADYVQAKNLVRVFGKESRKTTHILPP